MGKASSLDSPNDSPRPDPQELFDQSSARAPVSTFDEESSSEDTLLIHLDPPRSLVPRAHSDPPAFAMPTTNDVIERYQNMVYAIALTHTQCKSDADDVFQEAYLTYHLKQPTCVSEEHVKAWLIRVALTCARRMTHNSWRTRVVPMTPDAPELALETFHAETESQQDAFDALSRLSETYRSVLHLFYIEDLPIADIALALGITPAAVKMRLTRGREMMRDYLKETDHD